MNEHPSPKHAGRFLFMGRLCGICLPRAQIKIIPAHLFPSPLDPGMESFSWGFTVRRTGSQRLVGTQAAGERGRGEVGCGAATLAGLPCGQRTEVWRVTRIAKGAGSSGGTIHLCSFPGRSSCASGLSTRAVSLVTKAHLPGQRRGACAVCRSVKWQTASVRILSRCDKASQTEWLKIAEIDPLTLQEAGSPKSRSGQGHALCEGVRKGCFLPLPSCRWFSLACRRITPLSASIFTWTPLCFCFQVTSYLGYICQDPLSKQDPTHSFQAGVSFWEMLLNTVYCLCTCTCLCVKRIWSRLRTLPLLSAFPVPAFTQTS